jgi:hypothetical protein
VARRAEPGSRDRRRLAERLQLAGITPAALSAQFEGATSEDALERADRRIRHIVNAMLDGHLSEIDRLPLEELRREARQRFDERVQRGEAKVQLLTAEGRPA